MATTKKPTAKKAAQKFNPNIYTPKPDERSPLPESARKPMRGKKGEIIDG